VNRARKQRVDSQSPLVIGVDPAISDHDRTAIIRRRGRAAHTIETHFNLNTMELVGMIRRIIDKEGPAKVCIDCIGIGAGIVDRLLEIGYEVVEGVNVARSANDKDKFKNFRAELWHDMREWLAQEMPVQVPDSDELLGDLTSLGYKFDSSGRLQIESKDDLRKRA
jgi:phage terminase large subunit